MYYKFIKLEKIAMNYKLEKFWNSNINFGNIPNSLDEL